MSVLECVSDGEIICLDTARGRYFRRGKQEGPRRAADFLASVLTITVPADDVSADGADPSHGWRSGALALAAILASRVIVRLTHFRTNIGWASSDRDTLAANRDDLVAALAPYRAVRRWLPLRRRCLPDSLAMLLFLRWRGVPSYLVIGVTGRPFTAHCWAQTDSYVLSEPAEDVRRFTPILSTACPAVS